MVFGTNAKSILEEPRPQFTCPNCGTPGKMKIGIIAKYFHVMFIPTFSTGKKGYSQCGNCKQLMEENEMPPILSTEVNHIKAASKTPVWMFSGLFIFIAIMVFGSIASIKNEGENAAFIENPVVGDKYHIKLGYRDYTIFRVNRLTADSIFFDYNSYTTNKRTGLLKIDKPENYSEGAGMSRADAKKMLEENKIEDIVRS